MILELIVTAIIVVVALFIFIKNIKKGSCNCGCSSCPSKTKSCCSKNNIVK